MVVDLHSEQWTWYLSPILSLFGGTSVVALSVLAFAIDLQYKSVDFIFSFHSNVKGAHGLL